MRLESVFDHPLFGRSNYDGNKSPMILKRRNMDLGYRAILFICFRKAYYREKLLFSLPHFLGAQIVFCLRGPTCHRASWQPRQSATAVKVSLLALTSCSQSLVKVILQLQDINYRTSSEAAGRVEGIGFNLPSFINHPHSVGSSLFLSHC
ncbi:hypothetical protein AVEN_176637-1 [Araneus ventricosus]|uniref:Uncharacterized protein n=1 Tax=Araneus ventricosus TaxID=182803 RepID=A0A4Y2R0U3_ARAVE|nr:hypothetical protein AVEN_176637-1 [Araneus ventricosus]